MSWFKKKDNYKSLQRIKIISLWWATYTSYFKAQQKTKYAREWLIYYVSHVQNPDNTMTEAPCFDYSAIYLVSNAKNPCAQHFCGWAVWNFTRNFFLASDWFGLSFVFLALAWCHDVVRDWQAFIREFIILIHLKGLCFFTVETINELVSQLTRYIWSPMYFLYIKVAIFTGEIGFAWHWPT